MILVSIAFLSFAAIGSSRRASEPPAFDEPSSFRDQWGVTGASGTPMGSAEMIDPGWEVKLPIEAAY